MRFAYLFVWLAFCASCADATEGPQTAGRIIDNAQTEVTTLPMTSYEIKAVQTNQITPYNIYHALTPVSYEYRNSGITYYEIDNESWDAHEGMLNFGFFLFGHGDIGETPISGNLWVSQDAIFDKGYHICTISDFKQNNHHYDIVFFLGQTCDGKKKNLETSTKDILLIKIKNGDKLLVNGTNWEIDE